MNSLARRIRSLPARDAAEDQRPATGAVPGPALFPAHQLVIIPGAGAGLSPTAPLITSDGAAIPATGPGRWDQLAAAGRIR